MTGFEDEFAEIAFCDRFRSSLAEAPTGIELEALVERAAPDDLEDPWEYLDNLLTCYSRIVVSFGYRDFPGTTLCLFEPCDHLVVVFADRANP